MSLIRLCALVVFAACGALPSPHSPSDAGEQDHVWLPDAGEPVDAGQGDAGAFDDWRTVRGAPLSPRVLGEYAGRPYALSAEGFVVQSGCDAGRCELTFRDFDGVTRATLPNLRGMFAANVSPDGRRALLLDAQAEGSCPGADGSTTPWVSGDMTLIDLATGARLAQTFVQSPVFADHAFLRGGSHWRAFSTAGCAWSAAWRSSEPPFAPVGNLAADAYVDDALPDGRLLVSWWPENLEVRRADGSAAQLISTEATGLFTSGDFVHTFARWPTQTVTSFQLSSDALRTQPVEGEAVYPEPASHRFVALCGLPDQQRSRPCQTLDGLGQYPRAEFRIGTWDGRRQLAVAGREDFLVYLDGVSGHVVRRDLRSGDEATLPLPPGRLRAVGDGRAVVLTTRDAAWGIERERLIPFEGRLLDVLSTELSGADPSLASSQVVFVVTSSASGGEAWLTAWHVAQRRVVRLTDSLNYNPPFAAPFTAADDCAMPGFARAAGTPLESGLQQTKWLHFTEFVPGERSTVRVFVMPVDLSSPPRRFAELTPDLCAPPLASPAGDRLWLPVRTPTVVRALIATP